MAGMNDYRRYGIYQQSYQNVVEGQQHGIQSVLNAANAARQNIPVCQVGHQH